MKLAIPLSLYSTCLRKKISKNNKKNQRIAVALFAVLLTNSLSVTWTCASPVRASPPLQRSQDFLLCFKKKQTYPAEEALLSRKRQNEIETLEVAEAHRPPKSVSVEEGRNIVKTLVQSPPSLAQFFSTLEWDIASSNDPSEKIPPPPPMPSTRLERM